MKMLQRLKNWFRSDQYRVILSPSDAQIYSHLYGLKNARHFAWCRFNGEKTSYQSMVIDLNVEDRLLILDEPFGLPSHFLWEPGMRVAIEIKDQANRIEFKTRFARLEPENGVNRMMLAWPNEVTSHQRRAVFRVSFHDRDDVPMAQLLDLSDDMFPCLDLSFQGLGIAVPEHFGANIETGSKLTIQLWLPDSEPVIGKLEVARIQQIEDLGVASIGGNLKALDVPSKRIIDRYLVAVQRQEIRSKTA